MLGKPHAGWSNFSLGEGKLRLSCIDDVPFMMLEAAITCIKTGEPQSMKYDLPEDSAHITFCADMLYGGYGCLNPEDYEVLLNPEGYELLLKQIPIRELSKILVCDIYNYLMDWARWSYNVYTEKEVNRRAGKLITLCDELLKLCGET